MNCYPHITDFSIQCYPDPLDPIYDNNPTEEYGRQSRWIDAYEIRNYAGVPLQPYGGTQQYIAVMDDGVYRNHLDMGRLSEVGVNCYDRSYEVVTGGGTPNYEATKPGQESGTYWGRLTGHGTQIASLINGDTSNGLGIPSLAPGATILPIRMKQWTKTQGIPGVPTNKPTFSVNAHVKAVRALRFEFDHKDDFKKWAFYVRVVSMSFSYPSYVRNLPWLPNLVSGDFKTNLDRDLNRNDRLYVGAAGNEDSNVRRYPAAYANVLGVSGCDYNYTTGVFNYTHRTEQFGGSSNYMYDNTYPVSGVYSEVNGADYTAVTPPLPGYNVPSWKVSYLGFGGTSAATPQVAALAFHLYSLKPNLGQTDYAAVQERIVTKRKKDANGRYLDNETYPVRAPADFKSAINGW